jgi:hypothetical protein
MNADRTFSQVNRVTPGFVLLVLVCVAWFNGCRGGDRRIEHVDASVGQRSVVAPDQKRPEPSAANETSKSGETPAGQGERTEEPGPDVATVVCPEHPPELVGSFSSVSLELTIQGNGRITRPNGTAIRLDRELPEPSGVSVAKLWECELLRGEREHRGAVRLTIVASVRFEFFSHLLALLGINGFESIELVHDARVWRFDLAPYSRMAFALGESEDPSGKVVVIDNYPKISLAVDPLRTPSNPGPSAMCEKCKSQELGSRIAQLCHSEEANCRNFTIYDQADSGLDEFLNVLDAIACASPQSPIVVAAYSTSGGNSPWEKAHAAGFRFTRDFRRQCRPGATFDPSQH